MLNWYAVYVNVKHEKKVVQKLLEQHIEAYSPIAKKMQQWSDRKKLVEFPMLSGYVFVNIDISEKEKVLHCAGVFAFIKFNGVEAKIKESDITTLKSIEASGYDISLSPIDLKLFDEVEVVQGPLKGIKGRVYRINNSEFIQIELESIQQNIKVQLPKYSLKITSPKIFI